MVLIKLATGDGWTDMLQALIKKNSLMNQCIDNPSYSDLVRNNF